jgi:hypothetical protein
MMFTKSELDLLCVLVEEEYLRVVDMIEQQGLDASEEVKTLWDLQHKLENCYNVDNSL